LAAIAAASTLLRSAALWARMGSWQTRSSPGCPTPSEHLRFMPSTSKGVLRGNIKNNFFGSTGPLGMSQEEPEHLVSAPARPSPRLPHNTARFSLKFHISLRCFLVVRLEELQAASVLVLHCLLVRCT